MSTSLLDSPSPANTAVPALELRGISKTFDGLRALNGADLTVAPGEILGLLGANGSGKSTLIKVLAGFYEPDPGGTARVDGEDVALPMHPQVAIESGIRFVHQDLGLIPSLSVLENFLLGDLATATMSHLNWRRIRRDVYREFARLELDFDLDQAVATLEPVERAMLAVARAVKDLGGRTANQPQKHRGVLVLDEPTVFLSQEEVTTLFALVRRLTATGVAVVFVSHDLEEVLQICDRVMVLRDGSVVGESKTAEISEREIVDLLIGTRIDVFEREPRTSRPDGARGISVAGLAGRGVDHIDFSVEKGEVLGLTGLSGSGFEQVPYLLFGTDPGASGRIEIGSTTLTIGRRHSSLDAINVGMALVPADRAADAVVGDLSLADNVTLPILGALYRRGPIVNRRLEAVGTELLNRFRVKFPGAGAPVSALSGGNQQRVVLAKWLQLSPQVLLLHEPTQGVDVSARQEIYRLIAAETAKGMSVVCASSDHEQLAAICDRVLIFQGGRIREEITGSDITRHRINEACLSSTTTLTAKGPKR